MSKSKHHGFEAALAAQRVEDSLYEETVENTNQIEAKDGIVVDCKVLNVREEPDLRGKVLGQIMVGQKVSVVKEISPEWCEIITEFSLHGYVMSKYIAFADIKYVTD